MSGSAPIGDLAVVVPSCDVYGDLWQPFFHCFWKFWPDCPYAVYLVANHQHYPDTRVTTIALGEDRGWSSNLLLALGRMPHRQILMILDDYFICGPVDTRLIVSLVDYLERHDGGCLRLFPKPGPNLPAPERDDVGTIRVGADYRVAAQITIWDKAVLASLLRHGESAWEFELLGSRRADAELRPFFSAKTRRAQLAIPFVHAVFRGKWSPAGLALCRREGIVVDMRRPKQNLYDRIIYSHARERLAMTFPVLRTIKRRLVG